jgi:hypothetical protein
MRRRSSRLGGVLLLGAALGPLACTDDETGPPPTTGFVRGTITRAETGGPVMGAGVILVDRATLATAGALERSNVLGRYSIDEVPPGTYAAFVFHDTLLAYQRSGSVIEVRAGGIATHNVVLMDNRFDIADGYRIEGHVIDATTSEPLRGAYVEGVFGAWQDLPLLEEGYGLPYWAVTDEAGFFSVRVSVLTDELGDESGLEPIAASKSGYLPGTLVGTEPSGEPGTPAMLPLPEGGDSVLTVLLRLEPEEASGGDPSTTGVLRGRVHFLGRPVPGLPVALSLSSVEEADTLRGPTARAAVPVPDRTTFTDPAGGFAIPRLAPGFYVVHPAHRDGDGYVYELPELVRVAAAETTEVALSTLQKAIRPVAPPDRSVISDRTPEFRWEPRPTEPGYEFAGYVLRYATSHIDWVTVGPLEEPFWQVPEEDALPAGAAIRWDVEVWAEIEGDPNTKVASFEHLATFQTAR